MSRESGFMALPAKIVNHRCPKLVRFAMIANFAWKYAGISYKVDNSQNRLQSFFQNTASNLLFETMEVSEFNVDV